MAHVGVTITKRVTFRDSVQEFGNTYYYQYTGLNPGENLAIELIDRLVTIEKTFHSNAVSFVYARCWSAGGTNAENAMIAEKPLTGVGETAVDTALDRERAVLVQWPAGNDSRNRQVYLRKWYHPCGAFKDVAFNTGLYSQTTGFTSANRASIVAAVADINPIIFNTGAVTARLVDAKNQREGADPAIAHKYLEHHQFGDQWRG